MNKTHRRDKMFCKMQTPLKYFGNEPYRVTTGNRNTHHRSIDCAMYI